MNLLQEFPVSELGRTALIANSTRQMHNYGGRKMSGATHRRGTTGVNLTTGVRGRKALTNRALADAFKPVIKRFPEKKAADLANRSVQAVKHWRAGTRRIDSVSLLNMAREDDSVWAFVCQLAGRAEVYRHIDEDFYTAQLASHQAQIDDLKRQQRANRSRY